MNTVSIETWIPPQWGQIVGNEDLVEHCQDILRSILAGDKTGLNTMVVGPSRSGKTAVIKLFVQCLMCKNLDKNTLNPCWGCSFCKTDVARDGEEGLFWEATGGKFHYIPVDCANATTEDLRDLVMRARDYDGVRLIYLDEVHRLHRSGSHLEEMLRRLGLRSRNNRLR